MNPPATYIAVGFDRLEPSSELRSGARDVLQTPGHEPGDVKEGVASSDERSSVSSRCKTKNRARLSVPSALMPTRMSDLSVFLTLCGVTLFVLVMLALGMVHSIQAALGFAVIGYAILYLGSGLIGLVRDLARARR